MTSRVEVKTDRRGRRIAKVELREAESLMIIKDGGHYRLGAQLDDVVPSRALDEATAVVWCPFEQKWVES